MASPVPFALRATLAGTVVFLLAAPATAAPNLADIQALPQRGQSAEQTRRDRYECHNWAIEQTGAVPAPAPSDDEEQRSKRSERIGRVLTGAGIGAAVGGLIRGRDGYKDADEGALGGAVVGAAVGALIGRNRDEPEDEAFNDYFRALGACMEGRGYELAIAETEATAAAD